MALWRRRLAQRQSSALIPQSCFLLTASCPKLLRHAVRIDIFIQYLSTCALQCTHTYSASYLPFADIDISLLSNLQVLANGVVQAVVVASVVVVAVASVVAVVVALGAVVAVALAVVAVVALAVAVVVVSVAVVAVVLAAAVVVVLAVAVSVVVRLRACA